MSIAEAFGLSSAGASPRVGAHASHRTVEVRVVVSGREEDAFGASRADTLVKALKPIQKHLDGCAVVEMVGVERRAVLFGAVVRRQPLADLADAVGFLTRG